MPACLAFGNCLRQPLGGHFGKASGFGCAFLPIGIAFGERAARLPACLRALHAFRACVLGNARAHDARRSPRFARRSARCFLFVSWRCLRHGSPYHGQSSTTRLGCVASSLPCTSSMIAARYARSVHTSVLFVASLLTSTSVFPSLACVARLRLLRPSAYARFRGRRKLRLPTSPGAPLQKSPPISASRLGLFRKLRSRLAFPAAFFAHRPSAFAGLSLLMPLRGTGVDRRNARASLFRLAACPEPEPGRVLWCPFGATRPLLFCSNFSLYWRFPL